VEGFFGGGLEGFGFHGLLLRLKLKGDFLGLNGLVGDTDGVCVFLLFGNGFDAFGQVGDGDGAVVRVVFRAEGNGDMTAWDRKIVIGWIHGLIGFVGKFSVPNVPAMERGSLKVSVVRLQFIFPFCQLSRVDPSEQEELTPLNKKS